jgi:nucleoside-diphosphate-sugar epimerase
LRLFVFGYGFSAQALARRLAPQGWTVSATVRNPRDVDRSDVDAVHVDDRAGIVARLATSQAILITAPPGPDGCPALPVLVPALAQAQAFPDWIGYLSTTGVYGDRRGGWVFETSALHAQSAEGARRVAAERDWLEVGRGMGLTVTVFRLPGIYGPGRSAFDRLREGQARRIVAPGQVFSRIHVDDLATGLAASLARPRPGGVYNLCDDAPTASSEVVAHAAGLLGVPAPPEVLLSDANLSLAAQRFYAESKRVSNARAKAELGWRPAYPTYREGLRAVLEAEAGSRRAG